MCDGLGTTFYFPPHMATVFQALDLVFCGALKKLKASIVGDFGEDSVDDQSTKLVQAYKQMATSLTIHESFRKAGLALNPFYSRKAERKTVARHTAG
jgi:hypothetical protein